MINNQLNKLKLLKPENNYIDPKLIEKNIGISKEYNVFELRNAIGQKNFKKSINIEPVSYTHLTLPTTPYV